MAGQACSPYDLILAQARRGGGPPFTARHYADATLEYTVAASREDEEPLDALRRLRVERPADFDALNEAYTAQFAREWRAGRH